VEVNHHHVDETDLCPTKGTFRIKMNCGKRTNTRGELLALWYILFFACSWWEIQKLLLIGLIMLTLLRWPLFRLG